MKKEKILVIDDDAMVLQLSEDILKRTDYEVKTAADGAEGIRLIEKETFDLIITDVKMPDMNGLEVLKRAKNISPWMPVLMVTGFGDIPTAVKAVKMGAADFVEKPLERESFLRLVANYIHFLILNH